MASALVVPFHSPHGFTGVISVGSEKRAAFTPDDASHLMAYAHHAAAALSNTMAHGVATARFDIQKMALAAISGGPSVEAVCHAVVQSCASRLQARACSLFLPDGTGRISLAASTDKDLEKKQRLMGDVTYDIGEGITGWTAMQEAGAILRISSVEDEEELRTVHPDLGWKNKNPEALDPKAKWKSFIGAPLYCGNEFQGVVRLAQKRGSLSFIPSDEDILRVLSEQAGICLKFARTLREKHLSLLSFAHDAVGTPVGVICDGAELLADAVEGPSQRRARRVYRFARHLAMVMDTYILLGTGETIKASPEAPVDLRDLVDNILHIAMSPYGKKKATGKVVNVIQENSILVTDAGKLYAILYNLIKNAAAACREYLCVDCSQDDQSIDITITDDGTGIDVARIPLLATPARLGLHIARTLAACLGGRIVFEGRPNEVSGTVARLHLPRQSRSENDAKQHNEEGGTR